MTEDFPSHALWDVVRHGQSTWNESFLVQGQDDTARLTELGRRQAKELAHDLAHEHYEAIFSSDLTRAYETAQILADVLGGPIITSALLRERSFGIVERGPSRALTPDITGIGDGRVIDENASPVGGESLRDVYRRAGEFVAGTINRYQGARLLIVTHGGMVRALRAQSLGTSMGNIEWSRVDNCSCSRLAFPLRVD